MMLLRLVLLALRKIASVAVIGLLSLPLYAQGSDADSRWTVLFAGHDSFKKTECYPLQYFQSNREEMEGVAFQDRDVESAVHLVGTINGFAIYDVIHQSPDDDGPNFTGISHLKVILVERKAGEFCEIYHEGPDASPLTIEPSYIQTIGSEKVLVSRDPVFGNGGIVSQAYWTFDGAGPINIVFFKLIIDTLHARIPGSTDGYSSFAFRPGDLLYDNEVWMPGDSHVGPSGGHITIKFAFEDHRPIVVGVWLGPPGSRALDAPSPTPTG